MYFNNRDLKLENVMVEDCSGRVVLIDFGLSNFWTPGSALRTHCGSAEYAAPEVFDQDFPLCPKGSSTYDVHKTSSHLVNVTDKRET